MTDTLQPGETQATGPSPEDISALKGRIESDDRIGDYPTELIDELGSTVVALWDTYLEHQLETTARSRKQLVSAQIAANRLMGSAVRHHIEQQATDSLRELGGELDAAEALDQGSDRIKTSKHYRPDKRRKNWYF